MPRTNWLPGFCIAVLILVTVIGGTGCGGTPVQTVDRAQTLIYARAGESRRLDPIHEDSGESVKVMVNLFETLVTYADNTADLVPGLAESYGCAADGVTWTFKLRPNVRFHDETPCDAAAVVYSLQRIIQEKHPDVFDTVRPYAPSYQDIVKVEAADPLTVVITLQAPSAVFLPNLAMFPASIVSPTAVKKYGREFGIHPVGTGPFKFASWRRDQELTLEAFPGYWGGAPKLARVVYVPVIEPAVRIEQLRRGESDFTDYLPPSDLPPLRAAPNLNVVECPGLNVCYLGIQNEKPPLNLLPVRLAISHAIDKQELIRVCYGGDAEAAVNMVPREMWGHASAIQDRTFDRAKAKELLEQAAQEHNLTLPLKLELQVMKSARPYLPEPEKTAVFIKQQLDAVGIDVVLVPNEISDHFRRTSLGEHQLCLLGWTTDNADPDNFLYQLLDPDSINTAGGNNTSRYRNEKVHALLLQAKQELNQTKRTELYRQAQEQIFADCPTVPLVHTRNQAVFTKRLQGFVLHPSGLVKFGKCTLSE